MTTCPMCGSKVLVDTKNVGELARILGAVAEASGVSVDDIKGPRRYYGYALPRHIAMLLMQEHCPDKSLPQIGRFLGNRDHTTIMHGAKRARQLIETDERARDLYERARAML